MVDGELCNFFITFPTTFMKRATLKDIARLLNVSTSTVSRALNNHPDISDEIIGLVQRAARDLNYRPNKMAANLRNSRSNIIGLIIPEITMFFFPSVIKGIEEVVRREGFQLLVLQSNDSLEREVANVQMCVDQQVDGLLISLSRESYEIKHLIEAHELGLPIVLFDKSFEGSVFEEVIIDDEQAVKLALSPLIKKGCKNIAGFFGSPGMLITQNRIRSFEKALKEANINCTDRHLFFADSLSEGKRVAHDIFNSLQPDGVFVMSDELMAATMSCVNTLGIEVPKQCGIVGISDGELPDLLHPKVTHVHHDGFKVGAFSAERLIDQIKHPDALRVPKRHIIDVELVVMETSIRD